MKQKPAQQDSSLDVQYDAILGDISGVIDAARRTAMRSVNSPMAIERCSAAYWVVEL